MKRHNLCHEYDLATSAKDRINSIFFGLVDPPKVDWEAGSKEIKASPGCLCIEMEPAYLQYGGIVTSQIAAGRMRSDCGTVISVGGPRQIEGSRYENPSEELQPGDRVGVLPYDGKFFKSFGWGSYRSFQEEGQGFLEQGKLRMLGVASLNEFERTYKDWWEIVVLKMQSSIGPRSIVRVDWPEQPELHNRTHVVVSVSEDTVLLGSGTIVPLDRVSLDKVQPLNRWILIRRLPLQTSQQGVILPDSHHYREGVARVVATGPKCRTVIYRDWVIYQAKALVVDFEFGDRYGFEGNPKDYVLIHEEDIHAVLTSPVAA